MSKQIIGLGGGGFTMEPNNPLLDLYVLATAAKKNPKICFLPTASGDNENYIGFFEAVFAQYPCEPTHLGVVSPRVKNIEDFLLNCDIIYVGGGNTKSMLALWREWGVDKALKKAYDQGVLLAGVSAGLVCWFEECVTDSIPGKFTTMPCMGFLSGSACPHYDGQEGRPQAYHKMLERAAIGDGFAVDDGVALHFIDGKFVRAVSSRSDAKAYRVYREMSGKVEQEAITPEYLGNKDVFQKYIGSSFDDATIEDTEIVDDSIAVA